MVSVYVNLFFVCTYNSQQRIIEVPAYGGSGYPTKKIHKIEPTNSKV